MSEDAAFSIMCRVRPRHPWDLDAYDTENHAYRHDYIHPQSWHLELAAVEPPQDATSFQWTVTEDAGAFSRTVVCDASESDCGETTVEVPAQGVYAISLTISQGNDRRETTHQSFRIRDYLIVSLGDSYACGEGNPDEFGENSAVAGAVACNLATFTKFLVEQADISVPMEKPPVWQEPLVNRSYKAGPSRAVQALVNPEAGEVVTFVTFARSGAAIDNGFLTPREEDEWTDIGQVEEAKRALQGRRIDALIISVGGNDIHFPDRVIDLVREDLLFVGAGDGVGGDEQLNRRQEISGARDNLEKLPEKFDRLADAVAELNAAQVYLTEYPMSHFEVMDEDGHPVTRGACGIFDDPGMEIDEKDAKAMKDVGEDLNLTLRHIAESHGWIFVEGIADGFAGHGLCAEESYFVGAQTSCERQGNFKGTLHPNERGHDIYARQIADAIARHTMRRETGNGNQSSGTQAQDSPDGDR